MNRGENEVVSRRMCHISGDSVSAMEPPIEGCGEEKVDKPGSGLGQPPGCGAGPCPHTQESTWCFIIAQEQVFFQITSNKHAIHVKTIYLLSM